MRWSCVLSLFLLAGVAGCIRRLEIIDVQPDGSVRLTTAIEGDADDVRTGSAMPSTAAGWTVEQTEEKDGDKTKLKIIARRTVPAGGLIPDTYAAADGETAAYDVRFTTTVRLDRRADGTYYHFERRYHPRRWIQFNYFYDQLTESSEIRALAEKDPKDLTPEEREKLAVEFVKVEAHKTMEFLNAAGAAMTDPLPQDALPQDALLQAQMRASAIFDNPNVAKELIELLSGDTSAEAIEKMDQRVRQDVRSAVQSALTDSGIAEPARQAFFRQYDLVRADFQLSEDLSDEQWLVALRLPGRIIAHNAWDPDTQPSAEAQGGGEFEAALLADEGIAWGPDRCGWSFEGPALYDREVVLRATSFVPKEKAK